MGALSQARGIRHDIGTISGIVRCGGQTRTGASPAAPEVPLRWGFIDEP
jgi:hypothetical protein